MSKITFQLVTPERRLMNEEVDSVTCPTIEGQITVLPKHEPLVATLQHGELIVKNGSESQHIAVSGGFVEVRKDEVVILADSAEHAHEIDVERAQEAKKRAEESMKASRNLSEEERSIVLAIYNTNVVRLRVAQKAAHRSKKHMSDSGILKD